MEIKIAIILLIINLVFILTSYIISRKRFDGRIIINTKDPEKDTYRLEVMIPFGELNNRKDVRFVIFKEE